jgi:hypothetical protein
MVDIKDKDKKKSLEVPLDALDSFKSIKLEVMSGRFIE